MYAYIHTQVCMYLDSCILYYITLRYVTVFPALVVSGRIKHVKCQGLKFPGRTVACESWSTVEGRTQKGRSIHLGQIHTDLVSFNRHIIYKR